MSSRVLSFRVGFAVVGLVALVGGALVPAAWLAVPGAIAVALSEIIGVKQCRVRYDVPRNRTLRGVSEFFPALGVAFFAPLAMGVAVAVVCYSVMANGMMTVARSRGVNLERLSGETSRRIFTALAGMLLLTIPVAATTKFSLSSGLGTSEDAVIGVAFAVVVLAEIRALLDMMLALRKA